MDFLNAAIAASVDSVWLSLGNLLPQRSLFLLGDHASRFFIFLDGTRASSA